MRYPGIVYFSSESNPENDIVDSLIELLFKRTVFAFSWETLSAEDVGDLSPCLIIFSAPLGDSELTPRDLWESTRELFDGVPVLMLDPDGNKPESFPEPNSSTMVLVTQDAPGIARDLVNAIAKLTGIEPVIKLP